MTIRTYASAESFKQALEQRLRTAAKGSARLARLEATWEPASWSWRRT